MYFSLSLLPFTVVCICRFKHLPSDTCSYELFFSQWLIISPPKLLTFLSELLCVISATVKSLNTSKILKFLKAQNFSKQSRLVLLVQVAWRQNRTWEVKKWKRWEVDCPECTGEGAFWSVPVFELQFHIYGLVAMYEEIWKLWEGCLRGMQCSTEFCQEFSIYSTTEKNPQIYLIEMAGRRTFWSHADF
jgi:hypothetical protein